MCAVIRDVFEGGGDGFIAVSLAAAAEGDTEDREFVAVLKLEVREGLLVVGPGDDDGRDLVDLGEHLDGALDDAAARDVLVEFGAPELVALTKTLGKTGGWDDDSDVHGGGYAPRGPSASAGFLRAGTSTSNAIIVCNDLESADL